MITIQIDSRSKEAMALLEYLGKLDFVKFPKLKSESKPEKKPKSEQKWLVDDISETEKNEIELSLNKMKNGHAKFYSWEEVKKMMDKKNTEYEQQQKKD